MNVSTTRLYTLLQSQDEHFPPRFSKAGAQDINILGIYAARVPHIPLAAQAINSLRTMHSCLGLNVPPVDLVNESLYDDVHMAVHQVLRLCQRFDVSVDVRLCSTGVLQFVQETFSDDITHGGTFPSPIFYVRDAVNRTLWHIRTCHPNPARFVQLSKISTGMPRITHPQQNEKCSDCLIAKMRKAARGSDLEFEATVIVQGLPIDVSFMFQRSKNKLWAEILVGINVCNVYCIDSDLLAELIFGITLIGKTVPVTWLKILLTRIVPSPSITCRIVCMDLGGDTGLNPDSNSLMERHGYITQPTGAGVSSQNPMADRSHHMIANDICAMLHGAALACKYWENAFYFSLRVHMVLPHGTNTISSYHNATHKPYEMSRLRMFGCTIYALAPKNRMTRLTMDNVVCSIFLGYSTSTKKFTYENIQTTRICRATHATFDESELNTLPQC
jgi:hypothetical protein